MDLIQATTKTLKTDHDCFQLLDLQNFYYLSPASLLISTKNQSIWQGRYSLQNSIASVINYHPVENIKSALIEQTKKVLALVQINNLFNYYATTLVDHIKNNSDQFKKLIKAFHQNSKFNVTINALNQVEINHYWKDTFFNVLMEIRINSYQKPNWLTTMVP